MGYLRQFYTTHHKTRNIYLDREEFFDVTSAYVPLRVLGSGKLGEDRRAIDALEDESEPRLVILGNPGTGKTTLLKAFGVHLVSGRGGPLPHVSGVRPGQYVPIFVELRDFATNLKTYPTLAAYITGHVLRRYKVKPEAADDFFRQLIVQKRCVVLLDALDEVGTADYDTVRRAVVAFLDDDTEELPTKNARIVMTCREQNFGLVRKDWFPHIFPRHHALAPFSDDDIRQFVLKRAQDLPPDKTVQAFLEEVHQAGPQTVDLHRTPLTLTISLSLYISKAQYTIPRSIAQFYEEVIKELLQRHDFRSRPHLSKRNEFESDDKFTFLREFALKAALKKPFDDFSYTDLKAHYEEFSKSMPRLAGKSATAFITELHDNAGLLKPTSTESGDSNYLFAHRSFHEYLAAVQLVHQGEAGLRTLLHRTTDTNWRQTVLFYAALPHDHYVAFFEGLTQSNLFLAGHAVPIAHRIGPEQAAEIVTKIDAQVSKSNAFVAVSALGAILRSESVLIRDAAKGVVQRILNDRAILPLDEIVGLWGISDEAALGFLNDMAQVGTPEVVPLCIKLAQLKNDPRTVAPLWQLLSRFTQDPASEPAKQLVIGLLERVQQPHSLDALENEAPLTTDFLPDTLKAEVFPFQKVQAKRKNLATLLAWVKQQQIPIPEELKAANGFLKIFPEYLGTPDWQRLIVDVARKPRYFRPVYLGWTISGLSIVIPIVVFLYDMFTEVDLVKVYNVHSWMIFWISMPLVGFIWILFVNIFFMFINEDEFDGSALIVRIINYFDGFIYTDIQRFIFILISSFSLGIFQVIVFRIFHFIWGYQLLVGIFVNFLTHGVFHLKCFWSGNLVSLTKRGYLVGLIIDNVSLYWLYDSDDIIWGAKYQQNKEAAEAAMVK